MLCIYHRNCMDGSYAASIVLKNYPDARLYASDYGNPPPPIEPGEVVYIVDFSYKGSVLVDHFAQAGEVHVMDHHDTAITQLEKYFSLNLQPTHLHLHLDRSKCGAMITWEHFYPERQPPISLRHIENNDLWRYNLPDLSAWPEIGDTKAYIERAAMIGFDPRDWVDLDQLNYDRFLVEGRLLRKKTERMIAMHLEKITTRQLLGYEVPWLNAPEYIRSELADRLVNDYPFVAIYYDLPTKRKVSLRSKRGGINVGELAKRVGGGGHVHAASFYLELPTEQQYYVHPANTH